MTIPRDLFVDVKKLRQYLTPQINISKLKEEGNNYFKEKNYKKAIEIYTKYLEIEESGEILWFFLFSFFFFYFILFFFF
jgi:tetratricopeptide (TPR) repeat protein